MFWDKVYQDAIDGRREAQTLWAKYRSFANKQEKDPNIFLFSTFRGQPWLCLKCGEQYKLEAEAAKKRVSDSEEVVEQEEDGEGVQGGVEPGGLAGSGAERRVEGGE